MPPAARWHSFFLKHVSQAQVMEGVVISQSQVEML